MKATEHTMKTWDSVDLFYRVWQPPKRVVQLDRIFDRSHVSTSRIGRAWRFYPRRLLLLSLSRNTN